MATKRSGGVRPNVIRCPYCGEDYSVTYKRCPFCDGRPDQDPNSSATDHTTARGRHLANNTRGGGYGRGWGSLRILGTVISLGLIATAVWIVITVVSPLIGHGQVAGVSPAPASASPANTMQDSTSTPTPDVSASEPAESQTPSSSVTPAAFTLNRDDFTLASSGETFSLSAKFTGSGADDDIITWSSSDSSVATVSDAGLVTAVGNGTTTITATEKGGYQQECIVRCSFSGNSTSTGAVSLNRTDFTLDHAGETFHLKISGASGTPSWSIGNSSVATISGDGTVTAVGHGMTTVTVSVDGKSFTCTVRCSF